MIPISNSATCMCIKTYIFNNTVTFTIGEIYEVDLGTKDDSDLVAVVQPCPYAYVGMSKSRFAEHFEIVEKEKKL